MNIKTSDLLIALDLAIKTQDTIDKRVSYAISSDLLQEFCKVKQAIEMGQVVEVFGHKDNLAESHRMYWIGATHIPKDMHADSIQAMDWWNSFSPMIQQRYRSEYINKLNDVVSIIKFWRETFPVTSKTQEFR